MNKTKALILSALLCTTLTPSMEANTKEDKNDKLSLAIKFAIGFAGGALGVYVAHKAANARDKQFTDEVFEILENYMIENNLKFVKVNPDGTPDLLNDFPSNDNDPMTEKMLNILENYMVDNNLRFIKIHPDGTANILGGFPRNIKNQKPALQESHA